MPGPQAESAHDPDPGFALDLVYNIVFNFKLLSLDLRYSVGSTLRPIVSYPWTRHHAA